MKTNRNTDKTPKHIQLPSVTQHTTPSPHTQDTQHREQFYNTYKEDEVNSNEEDVAKLHDDDERQREGERKREKEKSDEWVNDKPEFLGKTIEMEMSIKVCLFHRVSPSVNGSLGM